MIWFLLYYAKWFMIVSESFFLFWRARRITWRRWTWSWRTRTRWRWWWMFFSILLLRTLLIFLSKILDKILFLFLSLRRRIRRWWRPRPLPSSNLLIIYLLLAVGQLVCLDETKSTSVLFLHILCIYLLVSVQIFLWRVPL